MHQVARTGSVIGEAPPASSQDPLALIEKCKQALFFPEDMLREIQREAHRQDRSMSWVVQQTWNLARGEISRLPSANDAPERSGVSSLGDLPALVVVILRDGALVGTEALPPGLYHVGNGNDCDLKLDDDQVSTHHASILFEGGQVKVADEESELGLFVNGEAVQNAQVSSRDEVRLGTHILKLRVVKKRELKAPNPVTSPLRALVTPVPVPAPAATPGAGSPQPVVDSSQPVVTAAAAAAVRAPAPTTRSRSRKVRDIKPLPPLSSALPRMEALAAALEAGEEIAPSSVSIEASAPAPEPPRKEIGLSTVEAPAPVPSKEVSLSGEAVEASGPAPREAIAPTRGEPVSSVLPDLDPFGPPDP